MPDKTKRTKLTNAEWESKKKLRKNKCALCEKSERAVAELQQAHLRAVSKGGTEYIEPMCPTCHRRYDKGLATQADLKKLGIPKRTYKMWVPKTTTGKGTKKGDRTKTATNNAIELDKGQTYLTKQGSEQEAKGIDFGDKAKLKDKSQELEVGRGKTVELPYYLPLNIDYAHAIHLDLANKEKVKTSAKLKWIPFFRVSYKVNCKYRDPGKTPHPIVDEGVRTINAYTKTLGEEEETQIFRKELEKTPAENQSFDRPEEYRLIKLDPHMMRGEAKAKTIDYVIQKNTNTIPYEVRSKKRKRGDDFNSLFDSPETRPWILKPLKKDVRIREIQIVYAPKWEIDFESKDNKYYKSLSGNTGTVFVDNVTYCSMKSHEGFFGSRKNNVAVCDVCGQFLCQEHIFKCPTCSSWLCEKDSTQCAGCKKRFCADHIKYKCFKCSLDICDGCALKCPICGEIYCNAHMTQCSRCGKSVCVSFSCTRKEGGLLNKKTVCKNC